MFGLLDEILGSLSLLLSNLLLFDSLAELSSKMKICDRYIIKDDVEVLKSHLETFFDALTDLLSLCDELVSVVAGNNRLQDLVNDGRQYSTIVIHSQVPVDCE